MIICEIIVHLLVIGQNKENYLRSFSVARPSHLKSSPHDFASDLANARAVTR